MTIQVNDKWLKLAAYLQREASKQDGFAILSDLRILVDRYGNPVTWTDVNVTKLMPKVECNEAFAKLLILGDTSSNG